MSEYAVEGLEEPLDLSKSHWLKSCPECSRIKGKPVFKPYPEGFGVCESRAGAHNGAQSWCADCRSRKL